MIAPGQALPRVHKMICCPGAMLSRDNVVPGQLHCPGASSSKFDHYKFIWIPLVFTQIVTENDFKHVYLFLVLSGTFLLKNLSWTLIMSMRKTTLAPGQLLRSVQMEKSYLGKAVTRCCTTGNPPLEVAPGQWKTYVNSYRRQTMHRGKDDPGSVSCPGIMWTGPKRLKGLAVEMYWMKRLLNLYETTILQ